MGFDRTDIAQAAPQQDGNTLYNQIMGADGQPVTGDTTVVGPPGPAVATDTTVVAPPGPANTGDTTIPSSAVTTDTTTVRPGISTGVETNVVVPRDAAPTGTTPYDTAAGPPAPGQPVIIGDGTTPAVVPRANAIETDQGNCNFRPDYELRTDRARQWKAASDQLRQTPIQLDEQGRYNVVFGDSLSGIAERNLRTQGLAANKQAVMAEMANIVELNRNRYPSLDCNKNFVRERWALNLPQHQPGEAPVPPAPPNTDVGRTAPEVTVIPPEVANRGSGNTYIKAREVNIFHGRPQAPQVVQEIPAPQGPPYYEQPPRQQVIVRPRPEPVYYEEPVQQPNRTFIYIGGNRGPMIPPVFDPGYGDPGWGQPPVYHRPPVWQGRQPCYDQGGWNNGGWNNRRQPCFRNGGGWQQPGWGHHRGGGPRFNIQFGVRF